MFLAQNDTAATVKAIQELLQAIDILKLLAFAGCLALIAYIVRTWKSKGTPVGGGDGGSLKVVSEVLSINRDQTVKIERLSERISDDYTVLKNLLERVPMQLDEKLNPLAHQHERLADSGYRLQIAVANQTTEFKIYIDEKLLATKLDVLDIIAAEKLAHIGFAIGVPPDDDPRWQGYAVRPILPGRVVPFYKSPIYDDEQTLGYIEPPGKNLWVIKESLFNGWYCMREASLKDNPAALRGWVDSRRVILEELEHPL